MYLKHKINRYYGMEEDRLGLTFSDVLLVPKRTPLDSRAEADLKTRFTKNVPLKIPLSSSNMATVTEHKMAIAMAREGGIGVIHQFMSVSEQVAEIQKVKRSTSHVIENPVCLSPNFTIKKALDVMAKKGITSSVITKKGYVKGIFTKRDYLFEEDLTKKISDVMTLKEDLIFAPYKISLEEAKQILKKNRIEKLPLIEGGKLMGLITTQDILNLERWSNAARDSKGRLRVAAAVGVKDTVERAGKLIAAGVDVIVLDIAHAHSDLAIRRLKEYKSDYDTDILVGNIATKEAARDLIDAGADGLKVGIGPSPVCTTRIISGSGMPQLTAIRDVYSMAKRFDIPVCADGGMTYPGDISKALAAGAESICSGSFFAGTSEAPGYIIMKDGKRYKRYAGSASYESNHERKEKLENRKYKDKLDIFVEGVSNLVDYKGPVADVIKSLLKGVRSGVSYCGARNIRGMQRNAEFIRVTSSGWQESLSRGQKLSE